MPSCPRLPSSSGVAHAPSSLRLYQTLPNGKQDKASDSMTACSTHQVRSVCFNRLYAQTQIVRNLLSTHSLCDVLQDLPLPYRNVGFNLLHIV